MCLGARNYAQFEISLMPSSHLQMYTTEMQLHYIVNSSDVVQKHYSISHRIIYYITYRNNELLDFKFNFDYGKPLACLSCRIGNPCNGCCILILSILLARMGCVFCDCEICKYLPKTTECLKRKSFINFWESMYLLKCFPALIRFGI